MAERTQDQHTELVDFGWKSYQRKMREIARAELNVGILADAGYHEDADGYTIADAALVNEFGSDDGVIPERPAHRTAFSENQVSIKNRLAASVRLVSDGVKTPKQALDGVGLWYVDLIREYIDNWTDPPNAISTQIAKGRKKQLPRGTRVDNPLVDTGRTKNAITHKVTT